tara:strand:+ start:121 stop:303 length:183 start_codon:yes stop_codon:yes gene_type:complete
MIEQDIRKQLKRILESSLEEGQKVELLAELVERTVKYIDGYRKIHKEYEETVKKIFKKVG